MTSAASSWWRPEGAFSKIATERDIFYCFRLLLGRYPFPEEWPGHSGLAGNDLRNVVRSYLTSREFAAHEMIGAKRSLDVSLTRADGFAIYTDAGDLAVGKHVAAGVYEPALDTLLRQTLKPGMAFVDLGANIGYFTMLAASLVGSQGYVLAVEPNLENVRLLEASRNENGFTQVSVAACAVGAKLGVLELTTAFSNGMTGPLGGGLEGILDKQIVPCLTLQQLLPVDRRVDFMKIDIEGSEHTALSASRDLLARWRPVIVSEFSPELLRGNSGVSGVDYLNFLVGLGYGVSVLRSGQHPADEGLSKVMQAYEQSGSDHIDVVATPL